MVRPARLDQGGPIAEQLVLVRQVPGHRGAPGAAVAGGPAGQRVGTAQHRLFTGERPEHGGRILRAIMDGLQHLAPDAGADEAGLPGAGGGGGLGQGAEGAVGTGGIGRRQAARPGVIAILRHMEGRVGGHRHAGDERQGGAADHGTSDAGDSWSLA